MKMFEKIFKNDYLKIIDNCDTNVYCREIWTSKKMYIISSIISLFIIVILTLSFINGNTLLDYFIFFLLFPLLALFYSLYKIVNRDLVMKIDKDGIFHYEFGLLRWDKILSIKKNWTETSDTDGSITQSSYFIVQTDYEMKPFKINISFLDISEDEFRKTITIFKNYNIYDVYNEFNN